MHFCISVVILTDVHNFHFSLNIVYGTVCGASLLMISAVVGVVSLAMYIRCKCKGILGVMSSTDYSSRNKSVCR